MRKENLIIALLIGLLGSVFAKLFELLMIFIRDNGLNMPLSTYLLQGLFLLIVSGLAGWGLFSLTKSYHAMMFVPVIYYFVKEVFNAIFVFHGVVWFALTIEPILIGLASGVLVHYVISKFVR